MTYGPVVFGDINVDEKQLQKSPVILAGFAAAQVFSKDFEQSNGAPLSDQFLGLNAEIVLAKHDDEQRTEVGIYHVISPVDSQGRLAKDIYGCHFHHDENEAYFLKISVHCHAENLQTIFNYNAASRTFRIEDFKKSAILAIDIFEKWIDSPALLQKTKFWQTNGNIEMAFKWTTEEKKEKTLYFYCHQHDHLFMDNFDCHRKSRPGPNEPK
jgi:hypothetical protein